MWSYIKYLLLYINSVIFLYLFGMVIYYYINLYSSPRYFMRYYQGLIDCFPSGSSDSYCILYFDPYHRKTTELALSALVLIICFIEIYYQLSTYGLKFQWRTISLTLIIGSLASKNNRLYKSTLHFVYGIPHISSIQFNHTSIICIFWWL